MKILITGGAGFVGSNLAIYMAQRGHDVTIIDDLSRRGSEFNAKMLENRFPQIKIINKRITYIEDVLKSHSFDLIYHFAAQVAVTTSYENPRGDFDVNAFGSFLVASSGIPVIFASTNKVYGDNVNNVPIRELDTRYDFDGEFSGKGIPENFSLDAKKHTPYGISKLTGEFYCREFGGVANRFSCMFGEHQHGSADQGWLAHFIYTKLRGEKITIFGDGKQVRDILHIQDVVRLLELEGENISKIKGEVFNIGGGFNNTISLLELCGIIKLDKIFGEWRPADQKVYYSDISKAKKLLGWEPQVSKEEGINRLMEWAKQNTHFWNNKS